MGESTLNVAGRLELMKLAAGIAQAAAGASAVVRSNDSLVELLTRSYEQMLVLVEKDKK